MGSRMIDAEILKAAVRVYHAQKEQKENYDFAYIREALETGTGVEMTCPVCGEPILDCMICKCGADPLSD